MADTLPTNTTPLMELGTTGLQKSGGRILEEFLPQLRGKRAIKVFTEMRENDPIVGAVMFAIEMLIRQVDWRIDPAEDSPTAEEDAEFVESCFYDMNETWSDTLAAILSFITYGFSVHEIVYKVRGGPNPTDPTRDSQHSDGRLGWRKLPVRAQESIDRWVFDETSGELAGVIQRPPDEARDRPIPADRFLLFRTTSYKGNPEGRSLLRNAYRPWYFKRRMEEIEGVGSERDLAGLPMAWVPPEILSPTASPDQRALREQIELIVRNVRRDEKEGVLFPLVFDPDTKQKLYDFQLLTTGGRRQFDTNQIVTRYDSRIAMTVLADFVMLGHEKVGSFALSSDKTAIFSTALGAWIGSVRDVFNRHAIPRLFRMNGWGDRLCPQLEHGDIETPDLEQIAKFVTALAGAGATLFPDEDLENWMRGIASMPPVPEEKELPEGPPPPTPPTPPTPKPPEVPPET